MQRDGEGRTALITGASSGIGLAFAEEFARHGFALVLTARRLARLETAAADLSQRYSVPARFITADLSDPDAAAHIFSALGGQPVDALINNAGYGVSGLFLDKDWPIHSDFLEVLVRAPCALAHLALPGMKARRYGRIVNIASFAGFLPAAIGSTLYPAAKQFMISFSESLSLEMEGTGVHVTAVCPGLTHTEFHGQEDLRPDIARMPSWVWMNKETVAQQGYRAVMRGRPLIVNGVHNALAASLMKLVPNGLALAIIRAAMKP